MGVFVPSFPLALPTTPGIAKIKFNTESAVAVSESPFSYEQQTYEWQGQRWKAMVSMPKMRRPDAENWCATMLQLNGRRGTFLMGDPDAKTPRGDARGTPVVDGASQTGNTLATRGWLLGLNVLKVGDYFQIGSGSTARMHKILLNASSDGAGHSTLTFWPNLRYSPADGAALVVNSAKTQWRLDAPWGWDADEVSTYSISFSATEAL